MLLEFFFPAKKKKERKEAKKKTTSSEFVDHIFHNAIGIEIIPKS